MNSRPSHFFLLPVLLVGLGLMPADRVTAYVISTQAVTGIAAGGSHSLFIKSDGSLWGMGDNEFGQLGLGSMPAMTNVPQEIVSNGVLLVAAGQYHSLFKKSDGSLWGMGTNGFGQLGLGLGFAMTPQEIVSSGVGMIAAGGYHSLYTGGGPPKLWVMGYNAFGQLGDGTTNNHSLPVAVFAPGGTKAGFTTIGAGLYHSFFGSKNTAASSFRAMGADNSGQLGNGQSGQFGEQLLPEEIEPWDVTAVAGGFEHSLFIKSDGSLWGMGNNDFGQLGDATEMYLSYVVPYMIVPSNVVEMAAGAYHSLFVKSDGSLWVMGDDEVGQLGDGLGFPGVFTDTPEEIVSNNVVAVAAGVNDSLFIKSDGSLWGMGDNEFGQLGDTNLLDSEVYTPVEIVGPPLPQLTINLSGTNVILTWPTNAIGFTLQSASALTGTFADIPGATNPYTNFIMGLQQFFRLKSQ